MVIRRGLKQSGVHVISAKKVLDISAISGGYAICNTEYAAEADGSKTQYFSILRHCTAS